jgi:hypothetical protein
MTLVVNDDAGDEKMLLAVDGRRIVLRRKGESPLKTSVAVGKGASWPLPFDAIVAALEGCDADVRLGANEDVSVVAARRGPYRMWRMRFLDADQPNAIDTSFVCGEDDALLGYRSQAGVLGFSMVVASVRSDVALVIKQQTRSETDVNPNDVGPAVEFDDE